MLFKDYFLICYSILSFKQSCEDRMEIIMIFISYKTIHVARAPEITWQVENQKPDA